MDKHGCSPQITCYNNKKNDMTEKKHVDYFLDPNDNAMILAGRKATESKRQLGDLLEIQRIDEKNRRQKELHEKNIQQEYQQIIREKNQTIGDLNERVGNAEDIIIRLVCEVSSFKQTIERLAQAWTPEEVDMVHKVQEKELDDLKKDEIFINEIKQSVKSSLKNDAKKSRRKP